MPSFSIRDEGSSDHLTVHVPDVSSVSEGWIDVYVEIKSGGFGGSYRAEFEMGELFFIQNGLNRLYKQLTGTLDFETLERQLQFKITGDGRGHFEAECEAQESFGGSRLIFTLKFDQTHIPRIIRELEDMLA